MANAISRLYTHIEKLIQVALRQNTTSAKIHFKFQYINNQGNIKVPLVFFSGT